MRHKKGNSYIGPCPDCGKQVLFRSNGYGWIPVNGRPVAVREDASGDTVIMSHDGDRIRGTKLKGLNHQGDDVYIGGRLHECEAMKKARRYIG